MAKFSACVNCTENTYWWSDPSERVTWYQHGENPEHRLRVTDLEMVHSGWDLVEDWRRRIHEYLDVAPAPAAH